MFSASEIRLARYEDKKLVTHILATSFRHDPHTNWLIEKSTHPNKQELLVDYVFEETFPKGLIYITQDNLGVALWLSEKTEPLSRKFINRNMAFLFKIGLTCVYRALKMAAITTKHFPKQKPYYYLYMIGVLPEGQGKGLASKLMNPLLEHCKKEQIPVFLETANTTNVEIYKKKGFMVTDTHTEGNLTDFFMKFGE